MSGILDMVTQSLGPGVTQQLSQRLGTDPQQAQGAIATALPLLLAGLHHQASQPGGADALHAAAQQHDGSALDDPAATVTQAAGGAATAQVLGPHQAAVQSAIAGATGLNGAQAATLVAALS
ncbi:MAG TPA: DUF937 domain-containing protein, partial [Candidatus Eisenbacteria bacterium]|nr:DUF937 domain-containing protein [Candidatus Eisenbacteria bacterium]